MEILGTKGELAEIKISQKNP